MSDVEVPKPAAAPATPTPTPTPTPAPAPAPAPASEDKKPSGVECSNGDCPKPAADAVAAKEALASPATSDRSDAPSPAPGTPTANFRAQFRAFSRFGDTKSDGKHLTLSQSDKWMKQAKVIDGKKITTTDTGIYFKKLKQQKLGMEDYKKFLEDLAKNKKIDIEELKSKMSSCGAPGLTTTSSGSKASATVDRLTDTTKYTGAHKQRFDETGKGKGIAGRKDLPDASGYVQGYQNKDTYSKTH